MLHANLATHYIPSARLPDLTAAISALSVAAGDETKLRSLLNDFQSKSPLPQGNLSEQLPKINAIFGGKPSVESIYAACKAEGQFGRDIVAMMMK